MSGKTLVISIVTFVIIMAIVIFVLVSNFEPSGMDPQEDSSTETDFHHKIEVYK